MKAFRNARYNIALTPVHLAACRKLEHSFAVICVSVS
jgi:hypothetical protein